MAHPRPTYHIDYLHQPNGVGTTPSIPKRFSGGGLGFKNYEAARSMADFWQDNSDEFRFYSIVVVTSYANAVPFGWDRVETDTPQ